MEAKALEFFIACVTAAGFGIAIAAFGCGLGQGMGLRAAVEGVARNPESSGKVTVTMLIGLALIESLCIYALVVALIAWLWFEQPMLALVIAVAMLLNLLTAAASGLAVPLALERLGIDPALSGSVILTTVTDVVGFVTFLGLGTWLLL